MLVTLVHVTLVYRFVVCYGISKEGPRFQPVLTTLRCVVLSHSIIHGCCTAGPEVVKDYFAEDKMCLLSDNPNLQSSLHDNPDHGETVQSLPATDSQPSRDNAVVEPSSVSEVLASPTEMDRRAILASPVSAMFPTNTPSVVPPVYSSNSLPHPMTPIIQRVWEVLRLLPPLDFVIASVDDYIETGTVWQTERFYSGRLGYSMSLTATVDQIGPNDEEDTYLSVFVYLLKGNYDDELKWPFTGYLVLQIVNWEDDHSHLEWTIRFNGHGTACAQVIDGERGEEGTVLENFVSLAELKRERDGVRFWRKDDDSIKLRVQNVIYP